MKHLTLITCSTVAFLLGTIVHLPITHAQEPSAASHKVTYYNLSFLKSLPGQDPASLEREKWAPIHKDLVQSGTIRQWTVLVPEYTGPHPYDYMTLVAFDDLNAFQNIAWTALFKKHWGEGQWQQVMKKTIESRDEVGNELWTVAAQVSSEDSK